MRLTATQYCEGPGGNTQSRLATGHQPQFVVCFTPPYLSESQLPSYSAVYSIEFCLERSYYANSTRILGRFLPNPLFIQPNLMQIPARLLLATETCNHRKQFVRFYWLCQVRLKSGKQCSPAICRSRVSG